METKHTQGKWIASPDGRAVYSDEKKCLIAMCEGRAAYQIYEREANRNAKLIAAAPDLLDALNECMLILAKHSDETDAQLGFNTYPTFRKAMEAIKKATT